MKEVNNTEMKNFKSVKEFVNYLIDNEGTILSDSYGRKWKYEKYKFQYKDIASDAVFKDGLQCVHLFQTVAYQPSQISNNTELPNLEKSTESWGKIKDKDKWLDEIRGNNTEPIDRAIEFVDERIKSYEIKDWASQYTINYLTEILEYLQSLKQ